MSFEMLGGVAGEAGMAIAAQAEKINKQAVQIKSSAKGFAQAAGKGFHHEPGAAATLISACQDAVRQLNSLNAHLEQIKQAPKLGQSPGGQVVSKFTQDVATDGQGIEPALEELKATLRDMISAYHKASTNYQETEAIIAQSLKSKA
jgi:hypothetical protein